MERVQKTPEKASITRYLLKTVLRVGGLSEAIDKAENERHLNFMEREADEGD